jgi:hypothetical protein
MGGHRQTDRHHEANSRFSQLCEKRLKIKKHRWNFLQAVKYCRKNTYLHVLTPWSRVLLEKLTVLQLVKKFPAFYGTRRFITAFASARHLSLSWASSIQSIPPHHTSWISALILPSHLRLGLASVLFPSGFPTKTLHVEKTKYKIIIIKQIHNKMRIREQEEKYNNACKTYKA